MEMTQVNLLPVAQTPESAIPAGGPPPQGEFSTLVSAIVQEHADAAEAVTVLAKAIEALMLAGTNHPPSVAPVSEVGTETETEATETADAQLNTIAEVPGRQLTVAPNALDGASEPLEAATPGLGGATSVPSSTKKEQTPLSGPTSLSTTLTGPFVAETADVSGEADSSEPVRSAAALKLPTEFESSAKPESLEPDQPVSPAPVAAKATPGAERPGHAPSAVLSADRAEVRPLAPLQAVSPEGVHDSHVASSVQRSPDAPKSEVVEQVAEFLKRAGVERQIVDAVSKSVSHVEMKTTQTPLAIPEAAKRVAATLAFNLPREAREQIVAFLLSEADAPSSNDTISRIASGGAPVSWAHAVKGSATPESLVSEFVARHEILLPSRTIDAAAQPQASELAEVSAEQIKFEPLHRHVHGGVNSTENSTSANPLPSVREIAHTVIERVKEMLKTTKERSITIQLDPPELGSINVTVRATGARIEAQILASSADLRAWLESNRSELVQALSKGGLELGSMHVGADARQFSSGGSERRNPQTPLWRPDITNVSTQTAPSWHSSGRLDYSV